MQGVGVWADTATALQGMGNWPNAHPVLLSLTENIGNIVGGAAWLMTSKPAGVVTGLVVNYGYEMVLGLMESNIEVSIERLASYVKGHDADITDEQARYLADRSMKVLRTVGKVVIHQVAARGFSAGRAAVGRQATKVEGRGASRATQAAKGVGRLRVVSKRRMESAMDASIRRSFKKGELCGRKWNLTSGVVDKKHHDWKNIFGDQKPTLEQVQPYVVKALEKGTWKKINEAKNNGIITGTKYEIVQPVGEHKIWVSGFLSSKDKIFYIDNAAVQTK